MFAPLFDSVIAPVKLLAWVKVMGLPPAVKLEVPGTVNAPVCVIAPPAIADKLPPLVNVIAGKAIAAVSNCNVKLRKLLKPVKLGNTAPAFVLRRDTSRIFDSVPPNTNAEVPKLLACVPSKMSDVAAVTATVVVPPAAVIGPVSLIVPPAVSDKFWPIVDVPMINPPLLVTLTLFVPELLSNTAPVKLLDWVKVIGLALALKLDVPGTVNTPV